MKKGLRIGIITLVVALAVSFLGFAIGSGRLSFKRVDTTTASDTTQAPSSEPVTESTAATTEPVTQTTAAESTTAQKESEPTSGKAPDKGSAKQLIGSWTDGAGMSGYEFLENGTVNVTYVNVTLPIINLPVNGKYTGTYTVSDGKVTIVFSIYTATITNTYQFKVEDSQLTLTNVEDGKRTVYLKTFSEEASTATTVSDPVSYESELSGSWVSSDKDTVFSFGNDGAFAVKFKKDHSASLPAGSYDGVYIFDGETLTVQYAKNKVTEKYTCSLSKNSFVLTDKNSAQTVYNREGTASDGLSSASELIGKWSDGANMSGYEFHEDGLVTATYVNINIPVVNIPINGTYDGAYSVSGDKLSISFSFYGQVIRRSFTFRIEGNKLSLTDEANGKTSVYIKK